MQFLYYLWFFIFRSMLSNKFLLFMKFPIIIKISACFNELNFKIASAPVSCNVQQSKHNSGLDRIVAHAVLGMGDHSIAFANGPQTNVPSLSNIKVVFMFYQKCSPIIITQNILIKITALIILFSSLGVILILSLI